MTASNHTTDMKRCTKCGVEYPRTTEHFRYAKTGADGLRSDCKECCRKQNILYNAANAERKRAYSRRYRIEHADKVREGKLRYSANNGDKEKAQRRRWYYNNLDRARESSLRWRANNLDRARQNSARYSAANADRLREQRTRRDAKNRTKNTLIEQRRRARKRNQPHNFTPQDCERMFEWWNYCCAFCGQQRDFWFAIEQEHFIAVKDPRPDNPGTVPTNMIPACKSCNSSKNNRDPIQWLEWKFGSRKAKRILARIEAYFEYVRRAA